MNNIKSAEEILYKHILADSEKQMAEDKSLAIKNPSFDEIVKNPLFQMHVAAMEEYASQFKQPYISEDVGKAAESNLYLAEQWFKQQSSFKRTTENVQMIMISFEWLRNIKNYRQSKSDSQ